MIRSPVLLLLLTLAAAVVSAVRAESPVPCDSRTNGGDYFEIECPLASPSAAEWALRVHFAGVHDDSAANLAVRVDGQPVACGPGSTTRLLAEGEEDGSGSDQSLECRLVFEGAGPVRRELFVILTWKHAQHVGHELVAVSRD